jgi:hypothetical protein
MAGGADVGGDGSVQWQVWADNVKPGYLLNRALQPHGHEQGHVDTTPADAKFKISIEIPPNPDDAKAFFASFAQAAAGAQAASPGDRVDFVLPIVAGDYDQIRIRWDDSPQAPGKRPNAMAAIIAAATSKKAIIAAATSKKTTARRSKKAAGRSKKAPSGKKRKGGKGKRSR